MENQSQYVLLDVSVQDNHHILKEFICFFLQSRQYHLYTTNIDFDDKESLKFIKRGTSEYDAILSKSHIIIIDSYLPIDFKYINKTIIFLPNPLFDYEHYIQIQKTLRFSSYNLFHNDKDAEQILKKYGLFGLLQNKNFLYKENLIFTSLQDINKYPYNEEKKKNIFLFASKITNIFQEKLLLSFPFTDENRYYLVSPSMDNYRYVESLPENVFYVPYPKSRFKKSERIIIKILEKTTFFDSLFFKKIKKSYNRELNKKFKSLSFNEGVILLDGTHYASQELVSGKYFVYQVDYSFYLGQKMITKWMEYKKRYTKNYIHPVQLPEIHLSDEEKNNFYNVSIQFTRVYSLIKKNNNNNIIIIYFKMKGLLNINVSQLQLFINDCFKDSKITNLGFVYKLEFSLSNEEIEKLPTQNKIHFVFKDNHGYGFNKSIKYTERAKKYLSSKKRNIEGKICFYLRQSQANNLYITVRKRNYTDSFLQDFKINCAWIISCLIKKKDITLLFEKDSSRYEESASVVYETLIDQGHKNVYFILDKNSPDLLHIKDKYKANIIYKYTFKHYLYFFMCTTFLGTELLTHVLELRNINKHVLKKVDSLDNDYVFLQHGVMYMISLDSDSRKYFQPRCDGKGKYRVVTSSLMEANHFIELGGYPPEQVIVCGLPKYDRNILYFHADKIVIMLTWRIWEYNQAMIDFTATAYYKMLLRIIEGIDKVYEDKIIILPHPLLYSAAKNSEFELKKYMQFNVKYDEILRDTKVLITDYSSIAYDAFYRGSSVIFYWEELDECLEHYGENTKLMLNKENVFGDLCYNSNDLKSVLDNNYRNSQKAIYIQRYNEIVEFHDGKNTQRLIEYLKKEDILS